MLEPEVQQLTADLDNDEGNHNPCIEDEDFFQSKQDAEDMEEAISKFMHGIEAQEQGVFKDLHRFLDACQRKSRNDTH